MTISFAIGDEVWVLTKHYNLPHIDRGEATVFWVGPDKYRKGRMRYGVKFPDGTKRFVMESEVLPISSLIRNREERKLAEAEIMETVKRREAAKLAETTNQPKEK